MTRPCTVCSHAKREAIDRDLVEGATYRSLTKRFRVSEAALLRRKANHIPHALAQAAQAVAVAKADDLLLAGKLDEAERVLLEHVRQVYKDKLRALVGSQPSTVTAQILAVSENIHAPAGEFGRN